MQMQSWSTETAVQLGRLSCRQTAMFLKRMRHCCSKRIRTCLWRFGLGAPNFFHFPPQGSEDSILVKPAWTAKKNFIKWIFWVMISPILDSTLPTEMLLVYTNPQSYSLSVWHLQELCSHAQDEHPIRTTCPPGQSDNFPNVHGFWLGCGSWVSHQSDPPQRLRNVVTSPSCGCYSFIFAGSRCIPSYSQSFCTALCSRRGKMLSRLPRIISMSQKLKNLVTMWPEDLRQCLLNISGDATP